MTSKAFLLVAALVTACGTGPAPEPAQAFAEPTWTRVEPQGLPGGVLTDLQSVAGWDRGFVLAGRHYVPAEPNDRGIVNRPVPDAFVSADGQSWRAASLDGVTGFAHAAAAAGYRDAAYLLGSTADGASVWRTTDGTDWQPTPVPGSRPGEALSAIAAGPHGVVLVAFDRPMPVLDYDGVDNRDFRGLRIWYSADGATFDEPEKVDVPDLTSGYLPRVTATERGFVVYGVSARGRDHATLLESTDGVDWRKADAAITGVPLAAGAGGGTTVVFTGRQPGGDGGPVAWRRKDGAKDWSESTDIGVGRLPDKGVGPRTEQRIASVAAWGSGFVAAGSASSHAAVWTSPDGQRWTKAPVEANGFEAGVELTVAANSSATLLVSAAPTDPPGDVRIWRAT